MTAILPSSPSLKHLKNEAKAILKAHKAGDASCCDVLRKLNRFADATDADILAADVPLKQVQFALAMHYGCKTWNQLRDRVSDPTDADAAAVRREGGKVWINGLEPHPSCENTARLRHHCMQYLGLAASRAWVSGGLGAAFEMNVFRGSLCPSGPTRQNDGKAGIRRLRNLGCNLVHGSAGPSQYDEFRAGLCHRWRR